MGVTDELLARLRTVPGAVTVFDTTPPDNYSAKSVALILQQVASVPGKSIDGAIYGEELTYQVSVRGANRASVSAVVQAVIDSLHGYRSSTLKYVSYESAPGLIAEGSGSLREYHAPVDFIVTT